MLILPGLELWIHQHLPCHSQYLLAQVTHITSAYIYVNTFYSLTNLPSPWLERYTSTFEQIAGGTFYDLSLLQMSSQLSTTPPSREPSIGKELDDHYINSPGNYSSSHPNTSNSTVTRPLSRTSSHSSLSSFHTDSSTDEPEVAAYLSSL